MSSLSEQDIMARAGAQSYAKGQSYYRSGYVSEVVRRGDVVTAVRREIGKDFRAAGQSRGRRYDYYDDYDDETDIDL